MATLELWAAAERHVGEAEETLDQLIAGGWAELGGHRAIDCPVCGGEMAPAYGVHALPIGGRCRRCATELR